VYVLGSQWAATVELAPWRQLRLPARGRSSISRDIRRDAAPELLMMVVSGLMTRRVAGGVCLVADALPAGVCSDAGGGGVISNRTCISA
jgi:hypothetical protein